VADCPAPNRTSFVPGGYWNDPQTPFDFNTGSPIEYTMLNVVWLVIAIETRFVFDEVEIPTYEKTTCGGGLREMVSATNAAKRTTSTPTATLIFCVVIMSGVLSG
jgi:hypothetical protein